VKYFLAIDIGASSGRHILGHYEGNKLITEEVYRFRHKLVEEDGAPVHYNIEEMFSEVLTGLSKCKEIGKIPERIGIDSFGVDYALLDNKGNLIGDVVSYRDARGEERKKEFLSPSEIYSLTGCQPHGFDSVYQLYDDVLSNKIKEAKTLLFLPMYLTYLLSGVMATEVSILSTSGLFSAASSSFPSKILTSLGINETLFPNIVEANTCLGKLLPKIEEMIGYSSLVYTSYSHDTAAAFVGSGVEKGDILLSSGTWSLLGVKRNQALISTTTFEAGFTNELSRVGHIRFLKNIMGMWIINRLISEEKNSINAGTAVELARKGRCYHQTFDVNDSSLLNPPYMAQAIFALLDKEGKPHPRSRGELYNCVYLSLAKGYAEAITSLENILGENLKAICVFGGGSRNAYLNDLTERATGKRVYVGPAEASAIGNLIGISKDVL